jgi:hypothetical protein
VCGVAFERKLRKEQFRWCDGSVLTRHGDQPTADRIASWFRATYSITVDKTKRFFTVFMSMY